MSQQQEKQVRMVDTTLRDGEQTAGVVFSHQEKVYLARLLEEAGVYQIEAGIPAMQGSEKEAIRAIVRTCKKASIMAWNRAVISDLKQSLDCGVDAVAISIATSDLHIQHKLNRSREWVLDSMSKAVDFARQHDLYVSVNAEDASRSDVDFLLAFATRAQEAGAHRVRYCDTIGVLQPLDTYQRILALREALPHLPVEMHMHNDFGLATANTLAGAAAGAKYLGVTLCGLGERAGNAPLEEVVMALEHLQQTDTGVNTDYLRPLGEYVSQASGRTLAPQKPILGSGIFSHESGIHVDGTLKNAATYEAFSPALVGSQRRIVVGKHSGGAAIKHLLHEMGMEIDDEVAQELVPRVRQASIEVKRSLMSTELLALYRDLQQENLRTA